MLSAIKSLYAECFVVVRVAGAYGDSQRPSVGLKQGCPLSATLFGLFIVGLHQHLQDDVPDAGVRMGACRVTDFKDADDVCLLACTLWHLQALLASMQAYCATVQMTISVEKTKVLVMNDHSPPLFLCNGQTVQRVPSFRYLGLHFHESGLVQCLITPLKAKMASAWAIVHRKQAQFGCGDTVNIKLRLLQTILVPTVHYGCEVWGMHSTQVAAANAARAELQRLYEFCLRRICGLPHSVPSLCLLCELDLKPLRVHWLRQTLHFWNKLARSPHGSFHNIVLLDNLQDAVCFKVPNFCRSLATVLRHLGHAVTP